MLARSAVMDLRMAARIEDGGASGWFAGRRSWVCNEGLAGRRGPAVFVAIYMYVNYIVSYYTLMTAPIWLIVSSIAAVALVRFGLIVLAARIFTANVLQDLPYTLDFSTWYPTNAFAVLLGSSP